AGAHQDGVLARGRIHDAGREHQLAIGGATGGGRVAAEGSDLLDGPVRRVPLHIDAEDVSAEVDHISVFRIAVTAGDEGNVGDDPAVVVEGRQDGRRGVEARNSISCVGVHYVDLVARGARSAVVIRTGAAELVVVFAGVIPAAEDQQRLGP